MSIRKSRHTSNFTVLPNIIFEQELTLEAIGLLGCLLKLPHDWVIQKSHLHIQLKVGREKLDRVFKELQDKGFILTIKEYDKNGKFTYNHIVYDIPYNNENESNTLKQESPSTALPYTADMQLQKKDILNKENKNNIIKETCLSFEEFWSIYPIKNSKKDCEIKFAKINESNRLKIKETINTFVAYKPFETYRHPNPLTYINKERWNDEIPNTPNTNSNYTPNTYREL